MAEARQRDPVLSPQQIGQGIEKACTNAYDLAQAAFLTDGQGLAAVARALYILSIEEYGKIGWMYWALSLRSDDEGGWERFWNGLTHHSVKNEVGRLMALDLSKGGLLPLRSAYFEFRFPFFAVTPASLDRLKQTMLYVNFDHNKKEFISPLDRPGGGQIDNSDFFEEVWRLIRYVAYNREHHVFDLRIITAFHRVNQQAHNRQHWAALMRLFYACVLNHPTGMAQEKPLKDVAHELKTEHGMDADSLVEQLIKLGEELQQPR